jgi:dihydroflavonol-4-reductase
VLTYARERGLPAVAMCVSNTFGPRDWQPNHGKLVQYAALGKMPFYIKGLTMEVVGIEDVADAFLLAAERGRAGERYIISERHMSWQELLETAATSVGAKPPRIGIPLSVVYGGAKVAGVIARLLRREGPTGHGIRMLDLMPEADHGKATRELGWEPRPTEESIRRAAQFYLDHAKEMGAK